MSRFQEIYREAVEILPELHMDVGQAGDEIRHRRFLLGRRKRLLTGCCTAAAVFLLCGAGTAFAVNSRSGEIRVNDTGFTVTGLQEDTAQPIPREEEDVKIGAGGVSLGMKEAPEEAGAVQEQEADSAADSLMEKFSADAGGPVEYDSVEEFLASGTAVVPIPDWTLFDTAFSEEKVIVSENSVTILMTGEERYFRLDQQDHRNAVAYSSGTAYMGESRDERTFTNSQGFSYVVFDTVDGEETKVTHAVIAVGGRDLTLDFSGFSQDVTEEVLRTLDLSVYFED